MSSDLKSFVKGITSSYAFTIAGLLISLWLVPFTLNYLSKPEYGVFIILMDMIGWLTVANLGITAAFNSKASQLLGQRDFQELSFVASTVFFSQLFSVFIVIIVGVFFVIYPEWLIPVTNSLENVQLVVAILILNFAISYISQPFSLLLIANKQIHLDNYLKFGLLVTKSLLTVLFLSQGFKLLSLAISSVISTFIFSLVSWYLVKISIPEIHFKFRYWQKNRFNFLLKNGIWFSLGGIAGLLIFRMDSYLIGKFINLTTVASFVITIKLYQIADTIHQQFFNTTRPYFAQTFGESNLSKLSKMYNIIYYLSFIVAFTFGITVMLINEWFISYWVGPSFYLGSTFNIFLCINFIIQTAVLPNRILLATTFYKIEIHNITRIFEGILKFSLCYFLVTRYGLNCIVIVSIICSLLLSNISLNILTSKFLKESFLSKLLPFIFLIGIPLIQFYMIDILKIPLFIALILCNIVFIVYYNFKKEELLIIKSIVLKKQFK